jgi:hypothetical protein
MIGEGKCPEAPDDGSAAHGTQHCIHLRPVKRDYVCCWCGDLFTLEDERLPPGTPHGKYQPRGERILPRVLHYPVFQATRVPLNKEDV